MKRPEYFRILPFSSIYKKPENRKKTTILKVFLLSQEVFCSISSWSKIFAKVPGSWDAWYLMDLKVPNPSTVKVSTAEVIWGNLIRHDQEHQVKKGECCTRVGGRHRKSPDHNTHYIAWCGSLRLRLTLWGTFWICFTISFPCHPTDCWGSPWIYSNDWRIYILLILNKIDLLICWEKSKDYQWVFDTDSSALCPHL